MRPGSTVPSSSRSVDLVGPAGRLEAILEPPAAEPAGAAVVCHPHPLHGGTMHNKVVYRAAKGAVGAGFTALRFNFRGVGRSEGSHDEGRGEVDDARAAISFLAEQYPGRPLLAAGFSFGAWVGLRAARLDRRVTALAAIGMPLSRGSFDFLDEDPRPLLIVQGDGDEFGPIEDVRALASRWGMRARLVIVTGAGHFFDGQLDRVTAAVREFCLDLSSRLERSGS